MPSGSRMIGSGVPMLWPESSPRSGKAGPTARELATRSRSFARYHYDAIVKPALARFQSQLSEGLGCPSGVCSTERLASIYSWERFAHMFAIVSARDWVLPMNVMDRAFLAPQLDLLNLGQVGIRAQFDHRAQAFVATATQPIAQGSELLFYYGTM